mmetsp:Transcript_54533/g.119573  ORF Transcript_54533/g.119573 Transcript_54533/m.119573 type:complete len:249 (+) Transcript_54533:65-811(+)
MGLDEQADEIEALQSIFVTAGEFEQVSDSEYFLHLKPHPGGDGDNHVGISLHVKYTPDYPDERAELALVNPKALNEEQIAAMNDQVEQIVDENMGMPAIYMIGEALQDFLKENNKPELSMHEQMLERMQEDGVDDENQEEGESGDEEQEEFNMEEEYKGLKEKDLCAPEDRVTPEAFAVWKAAFDQEMIQKGLLKRVVHTKPSGRQMFEADKELENEGDAGNDMLEDVNAELYGDDGDLDELDDLDDD